MNLCYYITSHGFGHGVRTGAISNEFSPDVNLWFRTALPEQFLREEVQRRFHYAPAEFDCGCVQQDGVTVNVGATVDRYTALAQRNAGLLDAEAGWLRENQIDGVVSDITPFAFESAAVAKIPSIAVTNFTWHDIYREYAGAYPRFSAVVDAIEGQYSKASLLLALDPPMPMSYFPSRREMPVTGRRGVNDRARIVNRYGLDKSKKIGLIYAGNFGLDRAAWNRLAEFRDWEFLGVGPLPGSPANFHLVSKADFRYQDLTASVDCVISKIGYGTYSESVIHGVPLIYVPREEFAEFPYLEAGVKKWGHGYRLEENQFFALDWRSALDTVAHAPRPEPYCINGAAQCAREIERLVGAS
jgi:hypothetical protein